MLSNPHPALEPVQLRTIGNALNLCPICASMSVPGLQELVVQLRLVAQEEKAFAISIQTADRIDSLGKTKGSERFLSRNFDRELRKNSKGFVKCNQHAPRFRSAQNRQEEGKIQEAGQSSYAKISRGGRRKKTKLSQFVTTGQRGSVWVYTQGVAIEREASGFFRGTLQAKS